MTLSVSPHTAPVRPSITEIRAQFPALASSTIFLDNAGGSQLPRVVIDAMARYLAHDYAQLGGDYPESLRARATVQGAHTFLKTFVNSAGPENSGTGVGEVALAASTSILCHILAGCYADALAARGGRNEIIVSTAGHESDVGPWMRLERRGFRIIPWHINPATMQMDLDALRAMLGPRTRLVAFPHVSNLLGEIVDVQSIARLAHAAGARVLVDGVAFAPHRAIDVRALECDFYVYSTYKVYGPHMAAMFGTHDAWAELTGPNHFFIDPSEVPYKFELGGVNHEGCAGILALGDYLRFLAGTPSAIPSDPSQPSSTPQTLDRSIVVDAFARMTALELPLQRRLIEFLRSRPGVRLIGPAHGEESRVSTISFTHARRSSREIALAANARGLALRYGHFYSLRLAEQLGLHPADGVVRASLVHYNTPGEVEQLIAFLDRELA